VTPWLIFTNRYYIRKITTDGNNYQKIAENFGNAIAMDILYAEGLIFFTDVSAKELKSMHLNGSNTKTVISGGSWSFKGIAVDWITRKLYWIDSRRIAVLVSNLNGTHTKTLLKKTFVEKPIALAVNPFTGYVYWSDWTQESYIGRMAMDGGSPIKLITNKLGLPNALTLDYETGRIWWADAHYDWIETGYTGLIGIISRSRSKNPCGENNGGCSHLCLIAEGGQNYTCACPNDFVLENDTRTCTSNCSTTQFLCGTSE
ncbi:LRP2-like protein, partial [Mya arenaria]